MDHIDITTPSDNNDDEPLTLPASCRHDGWTPFARCLFLQVLAETGRVSRACEYARMSPQSAYALRNRDALFAAGWDAACFLARNPLADALYEQATDGLTETITRNGEIIAERHRHDSRLSIAVLHRLDKRCDRAEDHGARHLPLIARWEEWLQLVAKGDNAAALALLDPPAAENAPDHQLHQLPLGENPTDDDDRVDEEQHFWLDEDDVWTTDYPPPPGFDGFENAEWGSHRYSRECTPEEKDLLDGLQEIDDSIARAEAERSRDEHLADFAAELSEFADLPPDPPSD